MPLTSVLYNRHDDDLFRDPHDRSPTVEAGSGRFRSFTADQVPTEQDLERADLLTLLPAREAAYALGVSPQHARRMWERFCEEGIVGILPRPRTVAVYAQLVELFRSRLSVGQELALDAPSREELVKYAVAARQAARTVGVALTWLGEETVVRSPERNPNVSAEAPWTSRGVRRYRGYIVLKARRSQSEWLAPSEQATRVY